jgi:hypothetical protein
MMAEEKKEKVVNLPSKLMPGQMVEHTIPSEDGLYSNPDFIRARIMNLEETIEETEFSIALAVERHEDFVKLKTDENESHYEANCEILTDLDKEFEDAKKDLANMRRLLEKLEGSEDDEDDEDDED